jgi:hypothetical protein
LAWLPLGLLGAWLGMVVIASLAFAVSLVARSQVAGIGVVVALYFGEPPAATSSRTLYIPGRSREAPL